MRRPAQDDGRQALERAESESEAHGRRSVHNSALVAREIGDGAGARLGLSNRRRGL
jgi:hypothetical protein